MPAAFRRGPGIIYEFKPYLLSGGIRDAPDAALLFDAITACGYRSQPNLVRAYQTFRDAAHITGSPIMTEPARIDPNDQWRFDMTLPPARIRRTRWSRSFAAIIKELCERRRHLRRILLSG